MTQQFGKTWWGQQWLLSLNNIDYSNRLPRGSSYARKGAVLKVDFKENHISAKVAGSRPKPYQVDIILPPFFDPELGQFVDRLLERPVIISKMLNRELDPEVLEVAEQSGLKVFPKQWTDFKMQCSCPDWAVPCKHLAAVIYKVCAEIDNQPFLVFQLHRTDLIALLKERSITLTQESMDIPKLNDLYFEKHVKESSEYDTSKAYRKLTYSTLSPIHQALVSLLSDYPPFYQQTGNFKEKYSAALERSVSKAQRILQGKLSLEAMLQAAVAEESAGLNRRSVNRVIIDEHFSAKVLAIDISISLPEFILQLHKIPGSKTLDYQPSTAALYSLFLLSLHLVANGAVIPQIIQLPDKQFIIRWLPAMLSKEVRNLLADLEEILPPDIFWWQQKSKQKQINKDTAINLLSLFVSGLIKLLDDRSIGDLFAEMFFKNRSYDFIQPGEEALSGGVQAWLKKYYISQGKYRPKIAVEELPNDTFLLRIYVSERDDALAEPIALEEILTQPIHGSKRFEVLQSLVQLSSFITGLDVFINSRGNQPIVMENEVFTPFLLQMIPAIQLLDIDILLPKSLQQILKPKASVKLKAQKGKSFLRLDQLLDFEWQVALGDTLVSESEFARLLTKSDQLLKFKAGYIYVSKDDLERLHKHFSMQHDMSPFQLLRAALSGEYQGAKVALTDEVKQLILELTTVKEIPLPQQIKASLRPYQIRGYAWMYRNAKIGFGSVIADDMGLGKTLQVITTLLKYKEDGILVEKKALVIAPTGLLSNWQAEFKKFAPALKPHLYHGTNRSLKAEYDILLTSYGVARQDASTLKKMPWQSIVIDEAQNIKNQDTAQAKAIKSIPADNFIAISGTPVENRLSELWSIMDYSNRGLLGNAKEFQESFARPIETYNDADAADKLKKVTGPFMMRRLKTDKSIISDLPDKIEMDSFASLVEEQAALYSKTLEEAMKEIEAIERTDHKGLFARQGLVLQMILALKQICNHPALYLKNKVLEPSHSGKLALLFQKLDTITESNEKVLVFTQFAEMGHLLQHFIQERYKEAPLFYHGGCSLKQRTEMVDAFQHNPADRIFILSLKAAGTGLNLTAANHVIHYDLWWNPAVEAQATDRAYRIGQKNNVMVHRFITRNTFEERINEMIQSKKALAEMTVATGENWIGELSNKELRAVFGLG